MCRFKINRFFILGTAIFVAAIISTNVFLHESTPAIIQKSYAQQNKTAANINNANNVLTYENPKYAVKMQYPSNWQKLELNQIAAGGHLVALVRFDIAGPSAPVPEDLAIAVENLTSPTTLDQYTNFGINGLRQAPNFQLIESSPTTLSNNPAHKVVFSYGTGPSAVKSLQVWTISGGKAYTLAFSSDPSGYTALIPIVQQMVNSFALQNAATTATTANTTSTNQPGGQTLNQTALSTNQTTSNGSSTFLTYENSNYGIKIQYPSTWTKVRPANQSSNDIVRFISPPGTTPLSFDIIVSTGSISPLIPLQLYANAGIALLKNSFLDFNLISSNATTLGGVPAQKMIYTASLPSGLTLKFLQFFAIKDSTSYIITSGTLPADFATYLPTIQKMASSFTFVPTSSALSTSNETVPNASTANQTGVTNSTQPSAANFESAKAQYLSAWNHTTFHSGLDTFIQEDSERGYGIYVTHPPVYKPGDTIVLYVEPVGYGFKQVVDQQGNTLNQINLTADITIAGSNGTQLASIPDIPAGLITSHNKNTELFLTLKVTQSSPFPVGDYKIIYTVKDGSTGKSFQIIKSVKIANIVASGTS